MLVIVVFKYIAMNFVVFIFIYHIYRGVKGRKRVGVREKEGEKERERERETKERER